MVFGYSTNAFVKFPLFEAVEKIARLGFKGVEIMGDRPHLYPPDFDDAELARLNKLLQEYEISVEAADVVREIGIFADRSDISEEIVRLRSHLKQFDTILSARESNGRKLEFLIQEMLRETNTIGSKANDAEIARHVVEIKTAIERMREMIQNVE